MWAGDLHDITYAEGEDAVREHFRTSVEYLKPVHIVRYVKAQRLQATMSPEVPENCGRAHRWTRDGTCANCLAVNADMRNEWSAPGWGDGELIDKPENFDEMVAAAATATKAMIEQGYGRGDAATKDAAWHAASAAREYIE